MKLDLHVHSSYSSDSSSKPEQILRQARKIGLAGIAITDHNTMKGNNLARKIAGPDIIVVRGMEISSSEGHILAYGIQEPVPKGLGPEETIELIREQGGIAVVAHPFRSWSGLGETLVRKIKPDAIEVQNSHSTLKENTKAKKLCQSMNLPMTAGSDSHMLSYLGKSYTTMPDVSTEDEVLEAIRKGQTKTSGQSRSRGGAIKDKTDTVIQWMSRGFKKL